MLVDLRTVMVASTKFQFDYGKASPRMSTLSLTDSWLFMEKWWIIFVEFDQQSNPAFDIVRILQHAVSTKVLLDEMVRNEYAAYSLSLSVCVCVCVCARARANHEELENSIISY